MPTMHNIAAALMREGVRPVAINNEFLFCGGGIDIATYDNFSVAMQRAPRGIAALIEQYLRLAQARGSFHV